MEYIVSSKLKITKTSIIVSIVLFIVSLTGDCFCTDRRCLESLYVLIGGMIGLATGGAALTWIANPLLLISWLNIGRNQTLSMYTSLFATLCSVGFLWFDKVIIDEVGHTGVIVSYQYGYWLWVASCVAILIGNLILYLRRDKETGIVS